MRKEHTHNILYRKYNTPVPWVFLRTLFRVYRSAADCASVCTGTEKKNLISLPLNNNIIHLYYCIHEYRICIRIGIGTISISSHIM